VSGEECEEKSTNEEECEGISRKIDEEECE